MIKPVAVLCAARKNHYRELPAVKVFDEQRDAWTFPGGMPIVAHPPCRSWSAFCAHQSKPEPREKELGFFCAEKLRAEGGVLEQPAFSKLFAAANLPKPGASAGDCWSIYVWQYWWGYPMQKATWLCFCKIEPSSVLVPFVLKPAKNGSDRKCWRNLTTRQRSATTPAFARWLVDISRLAA